MTKKEKNSDRVGSSVMDVLPSRNSDENELFLTRFSIRTNKRSLRILGAVNGRIPRGIPMMGELFPARGTVWMIFWRFCRRQWSVDDEKKGGGRRRRLGVC